jgi:hypothetical protein
VTLRNPEQGGTLALVATNPTRAPSI